MGFLWFSGLEELSFQASYLGEIKDSFLNRALNEAPMDIILGLIAVIAVLLICIIILAIRNKRRVYVPEDWVLDSKKIRELLRLALDQRSKFELQFAPDQGGRLPSLRCTGLRIEGPFLILEISGLQQLSNRWAEKPVTCYFQVNNQGQHLYHTFSSTVKDISSDGGLCHIRVHIPAKIESRQKRSYLRIAPPEEYLLGAAFWRGDDMPGDDAQEDLQRWPKPSLVYYPNISRQFLVTDISAGGIKLHIPREHLATEIEHIRINDRIMVMVDLWDPDQSARLRFWMISRVKVPILDFETRGMNLGLQFLAWARPKEKTKGSQIEWLRLSGNGEIEPLGNWIMRRHLELFRGPKDNDSLNE